MKWKAIHKIIFDVRWNAGDILPGMVSLYDNKASPDMPKYQLEEKFLQASKPIDDLSPQVQRALMNPFIGWWESVHELRDPELKRVPFADNTGDKGFHPALSKDEVEIILEERDSIVIGEQLKTALSDIGLNLDARKTLLFMFNQGIRQKCEAWDLLNFDLKQRKRAQKSIDRNRLKLQTKILKVFSSIKSYRKNFH